MAHFLFPASDSFDQPRRKTEYLILLGDFVRGSIDSIHALNLFCDLVTEQQNGPDSAGFLAFDPHVGDTACQLRVGMFLEVFDKYRFMHRNSPENWRKVATSLQTTVMRLEALILKARKTYFELTKNTVPKDLGLNPTKEKPSNILRRFGWTDDRDVFLSQTVPNGPKWGRRTSQVVFGPRRSARGCQHRVLTDNWDISHIPQLFRLVIYSYTLSKYKTFSYYHGTPTTCLDINAANDHAVKLMESSGFVPGKIKRPGCRRLQTEFRELQNWIAALSSAWLQALARQSKFGPSMLTLIQATTQTSHLGRSAVACYPGYLLQRELLAQINRPLILVDRHFCPYGYHISVFEANITASSYARGNPSGVLLKTPSILAETSGIPLPHQEPLGLALDWKLTQISIEELIADRSSTDPHMVVIGNSCNGTYQRYTKMVEASYESPESYQPVSLPHSGNCADQLAHMQAFQHADHDRIALALFAIHPPYAFELTSGSDPIQFVEEQMDKWSAGDSYQHHRVSEYWKASRAEADLVGTGINSIHVYRWQHVCLESKSRLGKLLEQGLERADLMPPSTPKHYWQTEVAL